MVKQKSERERRQRSRNFVVAGALVALMVFFYFLSLVRMGMGGS
jgi:hypothetical protein